MELSQEKKTQIVACHAKGMTVKEIAEKAKLTEAQVDVFLQSIGKEPLYRRNSQKSEKTKRSYNRLTEEQKEKILELSKDGLNMYEIAEKLDIKSATVYKFLHKVKEKEPATAATVTDSEVKDEKENVSANSFSNNNTDTAKSQVLLKYIKCDLYGIYEKLSQAERNAWDLGEMYARVTDHLKEVVGE